MPFNESFYGDAVARTELAQRWLTVPHWIAAASQGCEQFGPLHIYGVAASLALGIPAVDAGRWLSFAVGSAGVVPLYFLSRRLLGREAAWIAGLLFAFWGFHLQLSTTGASEALGLFFTLSACAALAFAIDPKQGRWGALMLSGLCLTLACAVRYDLWLLLPLLAVVCFRRRGFKAAVVWAAGGGLFPATWLAGNGWVDGDPFAPFRMVEAFHRAWVAQELGRYTAFWGPWGNGLYTAVQLLFWPGVALLTLGPWVAWAMARGLFQAWRERPNVRWCIVLVVLPALYFTCRAALLRDFVPLARFSVVQLALALPFAGWALRSQRARAWAIAGTAVLAVGTGLFTRSAPSGVLGKAAQLLRPLSPVSRNPEGVRQVAAWLRERLTRVADKQVSRVLIDADPAFLDLQVGFLSRLPESRLSRLRGYLERAVPLDQSPAWVVRLPQGALVPTVAREESGFLCLGSDRYALEAVFPEGVKLYSAIRQRGAARDLCLARP